MAGKLSKFLCYEFQLNRFAYLPQTLSSIHHHFSSFRRNEHLEPIPNRPMRGDRRDDDVPIPRGGGGGGGGGRRRRGEDWSDDERNSKQFMPRRGGGGGRRREGNRFDSDDDDNLEQSRFEKTPISGGRGGRRREGNRFDSDDDDNLKQSRFEKTPISGGGRREEDNRSSSVGGNEEKRRPFTIPNRPLNEEKRNNPTVDSFLKKFQLISDNKEGAKKTAPETIAQESPPSPPPPEEADMVFKKMKETGLIPNAVAMLDGLCKDGLVGDAMKLFSVMREQGRIPEVVIYTAVVEGFCKAHKFDDAKKIFKKMQNNKIEPNAFSFTILIQGLRRGKRSEDAFEICLEMLQAGHSPNVTTFTSLVDDFCREKGVREAESMIKKLREKDYFVNEMAVKEHLNKKGPFSPLVWEAILGKNTSKKSW
ncbi:hypothetical protein GIB67_025454 [Kingdonia uniflora]|uniref:Pentatricopeptide repeat-containing protein n=1 Tax=Kingdonia uniflora TaxID=39325 RepID=A0A7J7N148_9MAGN|nr:hypothetical protein GIB67_025454 [Kingdonia uniflora]